MSSTTSAPMTHVTTDPHLRSLLCQLVHTGKPVTLEGIIDEDAFLELTSNVERLGHGVRNFDVDATRYRWRARDGRATLYLPKPMPGMISPVICMLERQDPTLFGFSNGPLLFGGSVRTRLFFGDGYQDPDNSLYNSGSEFSPEPVVVFHVALEESRREVGLMAVDWLAGAEGVEVAICITVDVDEGLNLQRLVIDKWKRTQFTWVPESDERPDSITLKDPNVDSEVGPWVYHEKGSCTITIAVTQSELVVENGLLDEDALKSDIYLRAEDLALPKDLSLEPQSIKLRLSATEIYQAVTFCLKTLRPRKRKLNSR